MTFLNLSVSFKSGLGRLSEVDPKCDLSNLCEIQLMPLFDKAVKQTVKDVVIGQKSVLMATFDSLHLKSAFLMMNGSVSHHSVVLPGPQHTDQVLLMDVVESSTNESVYVVRQQSLGQLIGTDSTNQFECLGAVDYAYH